MPSKIQLDENLWFLFVCLQKSDYKAIDFNAVGTATNLKPPAARMRYTRLKRQIEGGTLIGTHGTPFAGGAEKIAEAMRKRKRGKGTDSDVKSGSESGSVQREKEEDEEDEEVGDVSSMVSPSDGLVTTPESDGEKGEGEGDDGREEKEALVGVKVENGFEDESSEEQEDSDDDMPIIKRRGRYGGVRVSTPAVDRHGARFQDAPSFSSSPPSNPNPNPPQIQQQYQYRQQPVLNPYATASNPEILCEGGQQEWQRMGLLYPEYPSLPLRGVLSLEEQREWYSVSAASARLEL